MQPICAGLNVLEMGSGSVAASVAGVVLADAGRGCEGRAAGGGPVAHREPERLPGLNRGKESLVADLRTPEGQRTLRDMASARRGHRGVRAGNHGEMGDRRRRPAAKNPALIHCAITGFGSTGPYADLKAYDSLVAAKWACGRAGRGGIERPDRVPGAWQAWAPPCSRCRHHGRADGARIDWSRAGTGRHVGGGSRPDRLFVSTVVQVMAKRGEKPSADARAATAASRSVC